MSKLNISHHTICSVVSFFSSSVAVPVSSNSLLKIMEALKYPITPKTELDITTSSNAKGDITGERKNPTVPLNPFCKIIFIQETEIFQGERNNL